MVFLQIQEQLAEYTTIFVENAAMIVNKAVVRLLFAVQTFNQKATNKKSIGK